MAIPLLLLLLLTSSLAHAQGAEQTQPDVAAPPPPSPTAAAAASAPATAEPVTPPAPPPRPAAGPPAPPLQPFPVPDNTPTPKPTGWDAPRFDPASVARRRHRVEGGFGLGVPVWLTPKDGAVEPGVAMFGRLGFVAGPLVPELTVAWQMNGVDEGVAGTADATVEAFRLGFGVRARFENRSPVTPFVSGALDLNWWHISGDDRTECGLAYCREVRNYDFGPGVNLAAGVAFEVADHLALDLGLRVASTFATGVFDQTELWGTPFLGLTFYH